jgi:hypothetical protein
MKRRKISRAKLANRMKTNRAKFQLSPFASASSSSMRRPS